MTTESALISQSCKTSPKKGGCKNEKQKNVKVSICAIILVLVVFAGIVIIKLFQADSEGIQSFMALSCEAQSCTEQNGELYLTIILENNGDSVEKTIRVSDDMKEELLSVDDMEKIIGVNISFTLSAETMKEDHIDTDNLDPFWYLIFSEQYDEDFLIVGISVNE